MWFLQGWLLVLRRRGRSHDDRVVSEEAYDILRFCWLFDLLMIVFSSWSRRKKWAAPQVGNDYKTRDFIERAKRGRVDSFSIQQDKLGREMRKKEEGPGKQHLFGF